MAFDANGLQLQFQGHSMTGGGGAVAFYSYVTNDTIGAVMADGYFDGVLSNGLNAQDNIRVFSDRDGVPLIFDMLVTAGGADVTVVPQGGGARALAKIAFGATELTGSEVNTSFSFPGDAVINDAYIFVADGESGTMDVGTQGTSNDPDGILDGIVLTNTGWVFPTNTMTTGSNEVYISATVFGALWNDIELGTDVAGNTGFVTPQRTKITAADPVSITSGGDYDSCSGFLFIDYTLLPTLA